MDLYQMLIQDHRTVDELFEKIEKSGENAVKTRQQLFEKLRHALETHTQIEEQIVYPDFKKHDGMKRFIGEALEEHNEVKTMLRRLGAMAPDSADWSKRIGELKKAVQHHVREEENEMFPAARKEIGREESEALAKRVEQMRKVAV